MTEALTDLLDRTEAALLAKAAKNRSVDSPDPLIRAALEGVAQQLQDRADQCESWAFNIRCLGAESITSQREAIIRSSCESWLRMSR